MVRRNSEISPEQGRLALDLPNPERYDPRNEILSESFSVSENQIIRNNGSKKRKLDGGKKNNENERDEPGQVLRPDIDDFKNGEHVEQLTAKLCYSVPEAAKLLGVSRNFGYELARRGALPVIRFGKRMLVPKAQLDKMLGAI